MSDIDTPEPAPMPVDMTDVTRHMRHARRITDEITELEDTYDREVRRIEDEKTYRVAVLRRELAHHTEPIRSYHEMRLREDPRHSKTLHTPYGRSKVKVPSKPLAFIDDADALTEWATDAAPSIVRRTVRVTDVRKAMTVADGKVIHPETGEIVPGVRAEVPEPSWSIDTSDEVEQ